MSWEYNGYTVATTWCYMWWVFTRVPESRVGLAGPGNPSVIRGCWKSSSGLYPVKIIQTKHHPRPVVIIISHIYILYIYTVKKCIYVILGGYGLWFLNISNIHPFKLPNNGFFHQPSSRHLVGINCGDIWKDAGNSGSIDPMAGFLKWVWVKIRYPNNWMVNSKLD
jgi:hypothetical protein